MNEEYTKKLVELADELHRTARKTLIGDDDEGNEMNASEMKLLSDIAYLVGYIQSLAPNGEEESK